MSRITIIGAGNVAWALGNRLYAQGLDIHQIYARDTQTGSELARDLHADHIQDLKALDPLVDTIIIAVSDDVIHGIAKQLPNTKALVVHCSGSTPLSALPQKSRAVIWPLRSIARGQQLTWNDLNMVMEADSDLASVRALDLIQTLGAKAVRMDSQKRKTAHLVAVILNNFGNHLLHMADVLCEEQDMDRRIFQDLMEYTLYYSGPAIESQTGPAAREDLKVMERQMKLLKKYPHFQSVYEALSASIMKENND